MSKRDESVGILNVETYWSQHCMRLPVEHLPELTDGRLRIAKRLGDVIGSRRPPGRDHAPKRLDVHRRLVRDRADHAREPASRVHVMEPISKFIHGTDHRCIRVSGLRVISQTRKGKRPQSEAVQFAIKPWQR